MPIRKDEETGIWYVDVRSPSGKRVRCSARTTDKKAAQEYHDRLKADLWRQSMLGEVPNHFFEEGAKRFLQESEGQRDYETKVRHVKWWRGQFAGRALRSLTADEIVDALPTHSAHKDKRGQLLTGATKNRYLATMRRLLNVCVDLEWIDRVPKLPKYYEQDVRIRWEPPAVIYALIKALRLAWMQDAALVAVATGMRAGELFSLSPAQVDLKQATAHITHGEAKSKRARAVPLNQDAIPVLKRRMEKARRLVFTRDTGAELEVMIREPDSRDWDRACKAVGIEDFHWHDLRHTWASWHVQAGTPLMVLKELGGWETIEMVQKYAHLAPSHLAAHAQTVNFWSNSSEKKETPLARAA